MFWLNLTLIIIVGQLFSQFDPLFHDNSVFSLHPRSDIVRGPGGSGTVSTCRPASLNIFLGENRSDIVGEPQSAADCLTCRATLN